MSLKDPRITAVIPTYRRPQLLIRAIESALEQTGVEVVVQVMDNASGDETRDVVQALARRDPRVRYHCHAANIGSVANFQSGLERVETPFFSFLSDDDVLLPGFYRHALQQMEGAPGSAFFCGQSVVHDPEDGSHELYPRKAWESRAYAAGEATVLMVEMLFIWTACVFRTEVGRAAGPLPPLAVVDLLFLARAAARFGFVVSMVPCAVFTSWRGGAFRTMSHADMVESFRFTTQDLAGRPEVSEQQAAAIARHLEAKPARAMGGNLKRAFEQGDWDAFDQAAGILRQQPRLSTGKKVRLALGTQRHRHPLLVNLARRLDRLAGRLRRPARGSTSLAALIKLYDQAAPR